MLTDPASVWILSMPSASPAAIRGSRKNGALRFAVAAAIQALAGGYSAQGSVRGCRAQATRLARYTDGQGRPLRQRELCERHATAQGEPKECPSSSDALNEQTGSSETKSSAIL